MTLDWETCFGKCPLIAILRGIRPEEAVEIVGALVNAGIKLIEIPLNSPAALDSISLAAAAFRHDAILGAGTVLTGTQVEQIRAAGGRLIVTPNFSPAVASAATAANMIYTPGICTPSEAFAALEAGACGLKLFPAEMISPAVVKALRAVLPAEIKLLPVGGITTGNMAEYVAAGASGFGLGSGLYKPGNGAAETANRAKAYITAFASVMTEPQSGMVPGE